MARAIRQQSITVVPRRPHEPADQNEDRFRAQLARDLRALADQLDALRERVAALEETAP